MPTPSIQILRTDAQQVLNLDSISAVRSVVAASLANANAGTPLNPNLTTQQLWNEFYQIVTQPKSDIESIIANQLMKFLYAPPAPGGAGANGQVIFNDGGVLAGDAGLTYDKATDKLTVFGGIGVGISPSYSIQSYGTAPAIATGGTTTMSAAGQIGASFVLRSESTSIWTGTREMVSFDSIGNGADHRIGGLSIKLKATSAALSLTEYLQINPAYGYTVLPIGNLGIGVTPSAWGTGFKALEFANASFFVNALVAGNPNVAANFFYNASVQPIYKSNGFASAYSQYNGVHSWVSASSGTAGTQITEFATPKMTLDLAGNLAPAGNLVPTNGKGIDFSATPQPAGATSELLSDYEEGTWTPTMTFATPGTLSINYSIRQGNYTKVGNLVTARFNIQISPGQFTKGTASGTFIIGGLPFNVGSSGPYYFDLAASLADQSAGTLVIGNVVGGTNQIYYEGVSVSGTRILRDYAAITAANFAATNAGFISIAAVIQYTV